MNAAARNSHFLDFTDKLLNQSRWVDGVCRSDTHLWCENCGAKYELTETRCWRCDEVNPLQAAE